MFSELPIVDATGLLGNFQWEIAGLDRTNLSWTFESQLGLTLTRRIAKYEVIVVDDVQMPATN